MQFFAIDVRWAGAWIIIPEKIASRPNPAGRSYGILDASRVIIRRYEDGGLLVVLD